MLSVNQLDYLKQDQYDLYDDNDNINHVIPPFPMVSWIGVLVLWRSKALWLSDSQHVFVLLTYTSASVCKLNLLFGLLFFSTHNRAEAQWAARCHLSPRAPCWPLILLAMSRRRSRSRVSSEMYLSGRNPWASGHGFPP